MFTRWGDAAYRWRRVVPVIVVAVIALLYLLLGTKLGDRMSSEGWDDPHSESTRAAQIEQDVFGRDASGDVILLVTRDNPDVDLSSEEVRTDFTRQLNAISSSHPDQVRQTLSYFDSQQAQLITDDGSAAFASVSLQGVEDEVLKNYREIEDALHSIEVPGATVEVAGATAVSGALDTGMSDDIARAEVIGLPAVALLLILVFGSVVAACMPLLVGVLSILGSMGVLSLLADITMVNTFAQSVVTLLGLGLAIDYGLFMVSRYREELAEGRDVRTAVRNTTASAGKTVVFSALMVAVALSSLLLFPQAFLKSVAYGAISAVGLAALLSVIVLPSVFALLGQNIDKWTLFRRGRTKEDTVNSWWGRVPAFAMRHAKVLTVGLVGVLLLLTIPLGGVKFGGINETFLPPDDTTRVAQNHFDGNFPELRTDPVKLVIRQDDGASAVGQVYQQANAVEGLTGQFQVTQPTKDGVTVLSAGIADRDDNDRIVNELRDISVDGAEVLVAGTPAMEVESIDALFDKLPWMLLYIIVATFILLSLVFGSVILPAKAVIMNLLGTGATLGILTWMFVDGFGADLFNFSPGPLMSPVLVLIVAIIYGLSTDYEVFLVSRMVEARAHGATTKEAIRFGTATTGGIITAAAAIMIVVCGAFGFSSIVMMKYIAFGMIAALVIDATIIRMLLVPALMALLREDCWWAPAWVTRISEKIGHNERLEGVDASTAPEFDAADNRQSAGEGSERSLRRTSAVSVATDAGNGDADPAPSASEVHESGAHEDGPVPFAELMARLERDRRNDRKG
jgi:RND superfamily putative drug exporter